MKSNIGCISTTMRGPRRRRVTHARFRASFHGPFECPQLSRKSRLRLQTFLFFPSFFFFFQGGLSFPLLLLRDGGSRAATRRNDPILVHENAIIPVNRLSKRTEKGDGEKREREKNKNQSSPSTGSTTLPFDEVRGNTFECTHACIHVRTRICTRNRGERRGWRKGNRRGERERESLPSSVRNLAQAGRSARFNRGFPL